MASSEAVSEASSDGPVLSLMSKRLRALRKKHNRIVQMEEALAQGKPLNREQEEVLRSKPAVVALIDEYEKLRAPLSVAVQEELSRFTPSSSPPPSEPSHDEDVAVEDIVGLLYFGRLFDVMPQSEFTATMLTRTHERGCCLTYDYVTDDATELLGERDLDAISDLGTLVTSRPAASVVSHKNALQGCVQHARLWLQRSDQPVHMGSSVTYAGLREKLKKIMVSDYFTTTPEMKAPVDVAAAAGKYNTTSQVQVPDSTSDLEPAVQIDGTPVDYHQEQSNQLRINLGFVYIEFGAGAEGPTSSHAFEKQNDGVCIRSWEKFQLRDGRLASLAVEVKEQGVLMRKMHWKLQAFTCHYYVEF